MTDKIYSIDEIKHLVAPVAKEFELNEICALLWITETYPHS